MACAGAPVLLMSLPPPRRPPREASLADQTRFGEMKEVAEKIRKKANNVIRKVKKQAYVSCV